MNLYYVAAVVQASQKARLSPEKSSTGFSVLEIIERLESILKQAVMCLTVTRFRPDYSQYQGRKKRTRKYV
jgi:UDP-glucose 4-epimerase